VIADDRHGGDRRAGDRQTRHEVPGGMLIHVSR
jgi:hypothetical protein